MKTKNFLRFLFLHWLGRYILGAIFLLLGVFSEYSTIEFLSTDWAIFEYSVLLGVAIWVLNFVYVGVMAIYTNIKKPKK
jgi:hypothetical protein